MSSKAVSSKAVSSKAVSSKAVSSKAEEVEEYLYDYDNPSKVMPYRRSKETELSRFITALGL